MQQEPGASGTYSVHASDTEIGRYLAAARRIHALLILDIQPGYRTFARGARYYEKYLVQPDIGLALDSEWSMNRGDVPGKTIAAKVAGDPSLYPRDGLGSERQRLAQLAEARLRPFLE